MNVISDRLMTHSDLKVTMENVKKLKCLPREGKLKEYKIRLEDNARTIDIYGAKTNCLISFLNYDELDKKDSSKTWYEVLDRQEIDKGEFELYLYELDEYGKPLTLAKLKKKYGTDSFKFQSISRCLEKYGCTMTYYVDVRTDLEYILLANTDIKDTRINPYSDRYKSTIDFDEQSYTSHFFYFNEEGYKILKNKPENYDPEFDNGSKYHSDSDFEGIEVPIYGNWEVRKKYLEELNAYRERESNRPKGISERMYSPWGNIWSDLHRVCTDKGMTEDDFSNLKELITNKNGYHYVINRDVKEFCKKFPGTYPYVKKFVADEWSCYLEAYNNSGWN